jgi:D-3-phosphoglycerate dehydrogenase
MNLDALNCATMAGFMKSSNPEVNMVSAPLIAEERGINVSKTTQKKSGVFDAYMKLSVETESRTRTIAGTVFSDGKPRLIQIKGINLDAEIAEHMLYTTNRDVPGIIGALGETLGKHGVNIANFTLGRTRAGEDAIALFSLDDAASDACLKDLEATGLFQQVRPLHFEEV